LCGDRTALRPLGLNRKYAMQSQWASKRIKGGRRAYELQPRMGDEAVCSVRMRSERFWA
jgi:hypothetical protein